MKALNNYGIGSFGNSYIIINNRIIVDFIIDFIIINITRNVNTI